MDFSTAKILLSKIRYVLLVNEYLRIISISDFESNYSSVQDKTFTTERFKITDIGNFIFPMFIWSYVLLTNKNSFYNIASGVNGFGSKIFW